MNTHIIIDGVFGKEIRITQERINHILENHPEFDNTVFDKITETLQFPDEIIESKSDNCVNLYYKKYVKTEIGDKLLCVVTKTNEIDTFMLTAYFTDKIKTGTIIWKKI